CCTVFCIASTRWVVSWSLLLCFCFFFQAEDGIRDRNVTGVQTCALPISTMIPAQIIGFLGVVLITVTIFQGWSVWLLIIGAVMRSEERRVGKECRSRRGRYR